MSRTKKRQLSLLLISQQSNHEFEPNNDVIPDSDDLDIHRSYSRPKLITVDPDDSDISDRVKLRLFLARQKAVEKHREVWG